MTILILIGEINGAGEWDSAIENCSRMVHAFYDWNGFVCGISIITSDRTPIFDHALNGRMAGSSLSIIMYAIGAPGLGSLSDRLGKRKLIVIGLLGFTAGNALTSLASSFPILVASRILAGLSAAAITPSIYAITGDVASLEQRGRWLAVVGSGLLMALWAGAPIGTYTSQLAGWQTVFGGLAVISLVLTVLNQQVWPMNQPVQSKASGGPTRNSLRTVLTDVSVTTFWGAAVYGLYTYLGTGLTVDDHLPTDLVAAALIVYGIGATIGSLYGGRLADRWGASRVAIMSLIGMGILLALIALSFHARIWLFPLLFLWPFVGYAFFPAYQSRLAKEFSDRRGRAMAWNNTALYVGITLGALIGGWAIAKWSFGTLPFILSGISLLGGALTFIRATRISAEHVLSPSHTE